uniref:Uncharacterized protein LOC104243573 n=1 Tax=Nicotiana sylvestris TaxID=4096 RepID=A0A1U7YCW4_NICSY|nr:PREDICTED: uncharacterized protein LOC104243573 [Nicotiana sylvestris]
MPALPFPQKMKREIDKCFGRFLEMLKQLYMNIPFTEILTQIPVYDEFLKEILSSKRKLDETTVVKLNAHSRTILQNKIPQKCGDPGIFTIPCSLVSVKFDKALCNSDVSTNLMAMSVFRKLEGRSILDIYEGQLMLRVGNEKVVFQMKRIMKYPSDEAFANSCFKLDVAGKLAKNTSLTSLWGIL